MIDEYNDIELIDLYLEDKLDPDALAKFENRVKADAEFRDLVDSQRHVIVEIKSAAFRDNVKSYLTARNEKSSVIQFPYWKWIGMAASVVIVIASIVYLAMPRENLFEQYFEPYPDLISTRNKSSESTDAMYNYNSGKYALAIASFAKIDSLSNQEKFYLGVSYLVVP